MHKYMCIRLYVLMYSTDITTNALKLVNFGLSFVYSFIFF